MRKILMLLVLALVVPAVAYGVVTRSLNMKNIDAICIGTWIDTDTTEVWVTAQGNRVDVTLFDNGETVVIAPDICSLYGDTSTCDDYCWDHDGNGTKTQCTLNGDGTAFTRGAAFPNVSVIRLEVTTPPSTSTTVWVEACPS